MSFPKLKNALLCRITVYVAVIGSFALPAVILCSLPFVPDTGKALAFIAACILLLIYIAKNIRLLMGMDILLAKLHAHNTARQNFNCPRAAKPDKIKKSILRHGKGYQPLSLYPRPEILRYQSRMCFTVYARGVEKILMVYSTGCLDEDSYQEITTSALANARAMIGRKKPPVLDKRQKKAPMTTAAVAVIFASQVEERLREKLFDRVQKQTGDGLDFSILPCVIDLQAMQCTFDSVRLPYYGLGYPAQNRGYHLIKKHIFGGKLPMKGNTRTLTPMTEEEIDLRPETSLWSFWRTAKKQIITEEKRINKQFARLRHGEIFLDGNFLYGKFGDRGIFLNFETDEANLCVTVEEVYQWDSPKVSLVSKNDKKSIESRITQHFSSLGYRTVFKQYDSE